MKGHGFSLIHVKDGPISSCSAREASEGDLGRMRVSRSWIASRECDAEAVLYEDEDRPLLAQDKAR